MKTQTAEQKNKQNELKENKGLSDTPEKKNIKLNKVTNLIYNLKFKFNHKIQILKTIHSKMHMGWKFSIIQLH